MKIGRFQIQLVIEFERYIIRFSYIYILRSSVSKFKSSLFSVFTLIKTYKLTCQKLLQEIQNKEIFQSYQNKYFFRHGNNFYLFLSISQKVFFLNIFIANFLYLKVGEYPILNEQERRLVTCKCYRSYNQYRKFFPHLFCDYAQSQTSFSLSFFLERGGKLSH